LLQGSHKGDQQAVLHDIGAITSMKAMAIIHGNSKSRRSALMRTAGRGSRAQGDGSKQSGARTESGGKLQKIPPKASMLRERSSPEERASRSQGMFDRRGAGCDWHGVARCRPTVHMPPHDQNCGASACAPVRSGPAPARCRTTWIGRLPSFHVRMSATARTRSLTVLPFANFRRPNEKRPRRCRGPFSISLGLGLATTATGAAAAHPPVEPTHGMSPRCTSALPTRSS
jgi:hypothetical protein